MSVIQKFVKSQLSNLPGPVGFIQYHGIMKLMGRPAFEEKQMEEFAVQMFEAFLQVQKEAQQIILSQKV